MATFCRVVSLVLFPFFSFHLPAIVRIPPFHLILAFHLSNLPDMIWFVSSLRLEYTCSRCFFTYEPDRTFQCLKIRRSILLSYTKAGFWGSEILWNIRSGRIMTSRLTTGQRQQVFFLSFMCAASGTKSWHSDAAAGLIVWGSSILKSIKSTHLIS